MMVPNTNSKLDGIWVDLGALIGYSQDCFLPFLKTITTCLVHQYPNVVLGSQRLKLVLVIIVMFQQTNWLPVWGSVWWGAWGPSYPRWGPACVPSLLGSLPAPLWAPLTAPFLLLWWQEESMHNLPLCWLLILSLVLLCPHCDVLKSTDLVLDFLYVFLKYGSAGLIIGKQ